MKTRMYALSATVVVALAATIAFGQWSVPLALAPNDQKSDKDLSVDFNNAKASEVMDWMRKSGVNFVVETSDIPKDKTFSIHLKGQSKEQVVEAIASVMGLNASKKGDIYTLTPGRGSWQVFSGKDFESPEKVGEWAKKFGKSFELFGPEMGKKIGEGWNGFGPETEKEFEKLGQIWKESPDGKMQWKGIGPKDSPGFMWIGPDGKTQWKELPKDGKSHFEWIGPDGKVKSMDEKEFNKWMEYHMKDLPKFDKDMPEFQGRFQEFKSMEPKIKEEIERALEQKGLADGQKMKALEKLKDLKLPDMAKIKVGLGDIGKLMDSLTPAQMEKMRAQGHLNKSDLTPGQQKMLGDWGKDSKFEITFEKDGKKVTIKGD